MEHGVTFCGMSSMNNENRSSSSEKQSDESSDDSTSSSKEYRDASCNVDFDEELDERIEEGKLVIEKNSRDSANSEEPAIEKNTGSELSRYVRWDVLMSLGIGLWVVLCIVDLSSHPEVSVARGWLHASVKEKKNVSKLVSIKTRASHTWWFDNLLPYLWKIVSMSNAGGAYVFLLLLLIVYCADTRLRRSAGRTATKKTEDHPEKIVQHSACENKIIVPCEESPRIVVQPRRKIVPAKSESKSAIYLHARILSSIEEHLVFELSERETEEACNFGAHNEALPNAAKILDASSQTECRTFFGTSKGLVAQLDIAGFGTFKLTNISGLDRRFITKGTSVASMCLTNANDRTCALRAYHLRIEENTKNRRKYFTDEFGEAVANLRDIEPIGESTRFANSAATKTRMITSSTVFKNFLSRLNNTAAQSRELAATTHVFRNDLQNV